MRRIIGLACLLTITAMGALSAGCWYDFQDYAFYFKLGSGVSCSESARVSAPSSAWNPAIQGYDSKLGNCAIAEVAVGCEFLDFVALEASLSTRSHFEYRKFQTPVSGGSSYTREFDLDVTPILFSVNLLGRDIPCLNWHVACGRIYPMVGAGIGVSSLLITNFRTTGLPPSGASAPFESFSAENQYTRCRNFTYMALLGFEYACNECWALSAGYRWLDAGAFKGPRFIRVATGGAVDVAGAQWKMHFYASEWVIALKVVL